MKKAVQSQVLDLCDTLINFSPSHRRIAFWFYIWAKRYKSLHMGIEKISKKSTCSQSTVQRFLRMYPHLVRKQSRYRKSNLYFPNPVFLQAMQFMDDHKILDLEKSHRAQKNWYIKELKKLLDPSYENVGICNPKCPNLQPYSPLSQNHYWSGNQTGKSLPGLIEIPERINRYPLPYEIKVKLSMVPEGIFQNALDSYRWKKANGWNIRDENNYVAGSAIRMAQEKGIILDWKAYFRTIQLHKRKE